MILNTHKSKIETSETLDHRVATVSLNPVVMHILSRDLYQKPIESPIREVLVNALDAHIESNVTRPVEIYLPSTWDEVFYVRDFGRGLSHEEFMDIYLDYGNSTRRDSNEVNGGLGLGTKSPLAYTSSFSVISYHGGEKREYLVYYNEDNIPCVDLLSIESSNETGIQVQFTTQRSYDHAQFQSAAANILSIIPKELYNLNIDLSIPERGGRKLGAFTIREGVGINIIMGFVSYKMESNTVLDFLSSKNLKLNIDGEEIDAYGVVKNLINHNCIDIHASIGTYPVHPSREYINITPRAISLLLKDFQNAINELFAAKEVTIADDIYRYTLTGFVSQDLSDLPVRARLISKWNGYGRYSMPYQINTYKELINSLLRNKANIRVGKLSQFDYTDYIGSSRNYYYYPDDFPVGEAALFIDVEERTHQDIVKLFDSYPEWDFSAAIAEYRIEKNKEREAKEALVQGSYSLQSKSIRIRRVSKSMQDSKHNVLTLPHGCFGSRKTDWVSARHNVQSLKDLNKTVYWVSTWLGKIEYTQGNERDILQKLYALAPLIFKKDYPIIIGLPASKGTKKIENEFKPLSELDAWLDNFITSPFAQRRFRIAELNRKLASSSLLIHNLDQVKAYGYADWLFRLNTLSSRSTITYIPFLKPVVTDFSIIDDKVKDLRIKFPDLFRSWGHTEIQSKDLSGWAKQVAEFTNCKPTGAKSKNVS